MTVLIVVLAIAALLWGAMRILRAGNRNVSSRVQLHRLATQSVAAKLESLVPKELNEGQRYLLAGAIVAQGALDGTYANCGTPDAVVAAALRYVDELRHRAPQRFAALIADHLPKVKDIALIRDQSIGPDGDDATEPIAILRILDDATDLVEDDLAKRRLHTESPDAVRLCAAQCVQQAFAEVQQDTTSTYDLRARATRIFEQATQSYGSGANAIHALATKRRTT